MSSFDLIWRLIISLLSKNSDKTDETSKED